MRAQPAFSAVLLLSVHFLTSSTSAQFGTVHESIGPAWKSDLRAAIGSRPLGLVVGRNREREARPITSLWFLNNETLIATFVTRENARPALSSRDSSDRNQPLGLQAIFLDASTGRIKITRSWPSESRLAKIVATHGEEFVTQAGETLTLYSVNGGEPREVKKLRLPRPPPDVSGWRAFSSPTGKSILFETGIPMETAAKPWIWVDAEALQIVRSWQEVETGDFAISDSTIAMTTCTNYRYHCKPHLQIRGLTTEWKDVAPIDEEPHLGIGVQFVNEDTIALAGEPWKLLTTSGKTVLSQTEGGPGGLVVSAEERRFVSPLFKLVGKVEALDLGGRLDLKAISIYDAPFRERSHRFDVKGSKIQAISARSVAEFALSPDGSKLAILYEGLVYLFLLPPLK